MHVHLLGHYPDVLAFLVCLTYAGLLGVGVKTSAVINSVFTLINLAVMTIVVCIGFYYAKIENWTSDKGTTTAVSPTPMIVISSSVYSFLFPFQDSSRSDFLES